MRSAVLSQTVDPSKIVGKKDTDFSVKGIIGGLETSSSSYPKVPLAGRDSNDNANSNAFSKRTPAATYKFTMDDIHQYFFGKARYWRAENKRCLSDDKRTATGQDCAENNVICSGVCQQKSPEQCPMHGPLQSLRKLVDTKRPEMKDKERMTYAIVSFPPEVQICQSSIPGHCYGVCARHFIPVGTWIGPYEGVRVSAADFQEGMDTSYMWEVYQNGQISSYLDGRDESVSSWMRFIRCARHKEEQNLFIFQYGDNIYYRAYKDISPGSELLVWYDDQYEKFLGVPTRLRYMNPALVGQTFPEDIDLALPTNHSNYLPSSRVPPTQPLHCDTQFAGTALPINSTRPKLPSNEINPTRLSVITTESAGTKDVNCGRTSPGEGPGNLEAGVWRCGQCFKSFSQRSLLQIHVCPRLPEKPYQCGHCAQSFSHPTDLRTHVVTHNSERPFKCGFCGRSFAGSTTLNNHIRTHTGQKPFVCEKCSRCFSQASQLSRHQRLPGDCCHRNTPY